MRSLDCTARGTPLPAVCRPMQPGLAQQGGRHEQLYLHTWGARRPEAAAGRRPSCWAGRRRRPAAARAPGPETPAPDGDTMFGLPRGRHQDMEAVPRTAILCIRVWQTAVCRCGAETLLQHTTKAARSMTPCRTAGCAIWPWFTVSQRMRVGMLVHLAGGARHGSDRRVHAVRRLHAADLHAPAHQRNIQHQVSRSVAHRWAD